MGIIIIPHFIDKEIKVQRVWAIFLKLLNSYISLLLTILLPVAEMDHEFRLLESELLSTRLYSLPLSPRKVLVVPRLSLPSSLEIPWFFLSVSCFAFPAAFTKNSAERGCPSPYEIILHIFGDHPWLITEASRESEVTWLAPKGHIPESSPESSQPCLGAPAQGCWVSQQKWTDNTGFGLNRMSQPW